MAVSDHPKVSMLRRAVRVVAWFSVCLVGLVVLAVVALQFPVVQRVIVRMAVGQISEKTHTRIDVGSVTLGFPHTVVLRDVFVEGLNGDTLLSFHTLRADVNLPGLLFQSLNIHRIRVDSLTSHITRSSPDSSFSFDFLLEALSDPPAGDTDRDTSEGPGWAIRLGAIELNGMYATYVDDVSGMDVYVRLGTLKASIDTFDLETQRFFVGDASVQNTVASVVQTKGPASDESPSASVRAGFGSMSLANFDLTYENIPSRERVSVLLGSLDIAARSVDLPSRSIALRRLLLDDTRIAVLRDQEDGSVSDDPSIPSAPWTVTLDQFNLSRTSVQYDVAGSVRTDGVDPNHLLLEGLTLTAENLSVGENRYGADIIHTSFREQSGFELRELSGTCLLDSLHAYVKDCTLETASSSIRPEMTLRYASLDALTNDPGSVHVTATIDESRVGVSDLLLFQPSLPVKNTPGATIGFSSQISGRVRDLRIELFRLTAGDSTVVVLSGLVRGLPEVGSASYDVSLRRLVTTRTDIHALTPDSLLPGDIVLPSTMHASGMFRGTAMNFAAAASIVTSIGAVKAHGELNSNGRSGSEVSVWKADVIVDDFDVGSLLNDPDTFGPVSMGASAIGSGLSMDDVAALVSVDVDRAVVNGYPYRHVSIDGTVGPNRFEGRGEIHDSSLVCTFDGTIDRSAAQQTLAFTLDVTGADLRRLNITEDDIRVAGIIASDLAGQNVNDITGVIGARDVVIIKNGERYGIDSIVVASTRHEGRTRITVESPILAGEYEGTITPGDLPKALMSHVSHYYALRGAEGGAGSEPQSFTFRVDVRDPTTLTDLVSADLHRLSAGTVEGSFDGGRKDLNVTVNVPRVDYGDVRIDSLTFRVTSDADRLDAALTAASIADSTVLVTNLRFSATAENDSILLVVQSTGSDGSLKMRLAGVFNSTPDGYTLRFDEDGIVTGDSAWSVPPDNLLSFGTGHLRAHNVVVSRGGQSLSLHSPGQEGKSVPLRLECTNVDLATVSQVMGRDSGLLGGSVNGSIVVQDQRANQFVADLTISDLVFAQRSIGNVELHANNRSGHGYEGTMSIAGNGNRVAIRGSYGNDQNENALDVVCDVVALNLASIEPFAFGTIERLSGTLSGGLRVTGSSDKPSVGGELTFRNTAFSPSSLGTFIRVNDGTILFDRSGVSFRTFVLVDTVGNTASITGRVLTEDFRRYRFDLRVHADRFLLLNKPASRDALTYGSLVVSSDLSVKGDEQRPIIDIRAELEKGSAVTVVLPQSELALEERRGIVRFVDLTDPPVTILSRPIAVSGSDTAESMRSALDLTAHITVKKEANLCIVVDPVAGDSLVVRGEAALRFTSDPSGRLTLAGRYEISKGSYGLTFGGFLKRDFLIEEGSSLTWLGSPYDADVDITAVYTVKASVLDLIQDQLTGLSEAERSMYKQEFPIQVFLMMKGKLLTPDIRFRLDLPPNTRGVLNGSVYATLNDLNTRESELNKQVFALLILGRFFPEQPLAAAEGAGELSGLARSSVSQILAAQLNRLSERYISGVRLGVGVESYEDYSTGNAEGRTQVQLALSKQFFDERVTVQVGGNVDVEGERSRQNALKNFGGDFKVLYTLTEDGRWQVQVFRQSSYEGAIDGDVLKTGAGIVFTVEYDKLFGITLTPESEERKK